MPSPKQLFHYLSYLQYPLMLIGVYFSVKPLIFGLDNIWKDYSSLLVFVGLGIGLVGMLKAVIEMFENHRLDKK